MHSSSTTEPPRPAAVPSGTLIGGFRIERALRATPWAIVYEATQLSLRRRVVLALHDDPVAAARAEEGARRQAHLHHPSILAVFETGRSEHGLFVARRIVGGGTLAQLIAAGSLPEARARRLLADVAAALEAAHAEGLVHPDLNAEAVLVEGERAFLAELVVPADLEAGVECDRTAFGELVEACRAAGAVPALRPAWPVRTRRRRVVLAGLMVAAAGVAGAILVARGTPAAPAVTPGAVAVGSTLAADGSTRDCAGAPPGPNSLACTFLAVAPSGRPLAAPADGVLRGWAVRGARGGLAVQVVRPQRGGVYAEVGRSQFEVVGGEAPQYFDAEVAVRRGDLLAVELQPGAGVGLLRRAGARAPLRWTGPLELIRAPREPDRGGVGAGELLVRFDVVPGARLREPARLTGAVARAAPEGEVLDEENVELDAGGVVRVAVVRAGGRIHLDLSRAERRLTRIEVPEADPAGEVVILEQGFTEAEYVRLQWRNPGSGHLLIHGYAVSRDRLRIVH